MLNSRAFSLVARLEGNFQEMFFFLPKFSFLGDRFGRKRVFDLSLVVTVALGVVTAFAPNWQVFGVIRALLGVPLGM